jgi:hypothetical protein
MDNHHHEKEDASHVRSTCDWPPNVKTRKKVLMLFSVILPSELIVSIFIALRHKIK